MPMGIYHSLPYLQLRCRMLLENVVFQCIYGVTVGSLVGCPHMRLERQTFQETTVP